MAGMEVLHGRRRGQTRVTPDAQRGTQIPDDADLRQVTILSKSDWDRIQQQLNRKQIEQERLLRMHEERESVKNRSKEMVKNWGNTIAGQRQRKLEARKLREQKEEEERVQVDLEEAKYQSQLRKDAIEKAKTQQYYQTDRVKAFHGALILTEVLKEREAQIELKHLKARAHEGQDMEWLKKSEREYEEAIQKDQLKAIERIKGAQDTASFQKAQIREHIKVNDGEKRRDYQEGDELQKLGIQYHTEKERLEEIRRKEKLQLMTDNTQQIRDRQTLKHLQEKQEEEEDEECRIFATAKRKMMKLRAEKEQQLYSEKQKHLEGIRAKLGAQMQQKFDDEDGRIQDAVQEAEEKRVKEEAEKDAKMRKMIQESSQHRYTQLKEMDDKKKMERRQELETIRIREAADEIFRRNEEEKRIRRRGEAANLKDFHAKQGDERKEKEEETRKQQLALDEANTQLVAMEESQFQEYAQKVIEHCEKGGRNVYPLRKAAEEGAGGGTGPVFKGKGGIRPSYMVSDKSGKQMPHYQRDTTQETKDNIYSGEKSKKRLGFVW